MQLLLLIGTVGCRMHAITERQISTRHHTIDEIHETVIIKFSSIRVRMAFSVGCPCTLGWQGCTMGRLVGHRYAEAPVISGNCSVTSFLNFLMSFPDNGREEDTDMFFLNMTIPPQIRLGRRRPVTCFLANSPLPSPVCRGNLHLLDDLHKSREWYLV